jgi:hypothetical protein
VIRQVDRTCAGLAPRGRCSPRWALRRLAGPGHPRAGSSIRRYAASRLRYRDDLLGSDGGRRAGRARGHWSWERHLLVAERTRPTVVAVTVSGGDLILVICGPG